MTPGTMPYNSYPTLTAHTEPGANCSATVVYDTGRSPVSFNGYEHTVPAAGSVSWGWHEETKSNGGIATALCTRCVGEASMRPRVYFPIDEIGNGITSINMSHVSHVSHASYAEPGCSAHVAAL
jgi:hypothetical protein